MGSRRSIVNARGHPKLVGALTHIYLVNHSETKDAISNGHINLASVKAENEDSDEDKDDDGGNIDGGAPGGGLAPGSYGARG